MKKRKKRKKKITISGVTQKYNEAILLRLFLPLFTLFVILTNHKFLISWELIKTRPFTFFSCTNSRIFPKNPNRTGNYLLWKLLFYYFCVIFSCFPLFCKKLMINLSSILPKVLFVLYPAQNQHSN